jgi:hypothetical protein
LNIMPAVTGISLGPGGMKPCVIRFDKQDFKSSCREGMLTLEGVGGKLMGAVGGLAGGMGHIIQWSPEQKPWNS